MTTTENGTTATTDDVFAAHAANAHRNVALLHREWARTGEHGWTETGRLNSCPGWWVLPGMVLQAKFSNRITDLGLGDVRVVGMAQQSVSGGQYAPWIVPVESIATGERATVTGSRYDAHEWHVTAPAYMLHTDAFHAVHAGALSFADEQFDY